MQTEYAGIEEFVHYVRRILHEAKFAVIVSFRVGVFEIQ